MIRENYSNSVDAGSTKVHFSSLAALRGFAHFDNGEGISLRSRDIVDYDGKVLNVAPMDAFFSLGCSTKRSKKYIGNKGQGSKLSLSGTGRFMLITRVAGESLEGHWDVVSIDNPSEKLQAAGNREEAVLAEAKSWLSSAKTEAIEGLVRQHYEKAMEEEDSADLAGLA